MKKKLLILFLGLCLCLSATILVACSEEPPEVPHTHAFGEWSETTAATCATDGEMTRSCACGEQETTPIPATGIHHYGADNLCVSCGARLPFTEGLELAPIDNGNAFAVVHVGNATAERIVLPAYHEGKPVTALKGLLVKNGEAATLRITAIEIPATVNSVDPKAFAGCTALSSITVAANNATYRSQGNCLIETASRTLVVGCIVSFIPENGSVTAIGPHAFYQNTALTALTVPHAVTSIAPNAFEGCSALQTVTVEQSNAAADPNEPNPLQSGWYVSETAGATNGTVVDVSNAEAVANALTDTYQGYYWYRRLPDDTVRY